jgi:hypothetical protein
MTQPAIDGSGHSLFHLQGDLVSLRISVEPRLLEDLLETLAELDFPVNPQLFHGCGEVTVEFPAYSDRVDEVRNGLRSNGFDPGALEVSHVLALTCGDRR